MAFNLSNQSLSLASAGGGAVHQLGQASWPAYPPACWTRRTCPSAWTGILTSLSTSLEEILTVADVLISHLSSLIRSPFHWRWTFQIVFLPRRQPADWPLTPNQAQRPLCTVCKHNQVKSNQSNSRPTSNRSVVNVVCKWQITKGKLISKQSQLMTPQ